MNELKVKILSSLQTHKYFVFMFLFFIIVYIFTSFGSDKPQSQEKMLTVDTLIPHGYTLVPIELDNIQAIASMIESYGVIDIYQNKKKILQKVKVLRAPYNPNSYSILLPDEAARNFMQHSGPFFAVIQNKSESSANPEVSSNTLKKSVKIEYNN
jgi:hypothetical protein